MRQADRDAIMQQLQTQGVVAPQTLATMQQQAVAKQQDVFSYMVEQRVVEEEPLTQMKAAVLGVPYVNLADLEIPAEVLQVFSHDIAENYRVVPFKKEGNTVSVALVDPHDYQAVEALDFIARQTKLQMSYFLASETSVNAVLRQYANLSKEVAAALQTSVGDAIKEESAIEEATDDSVKSAPVSKTVAVILRYAVEGNASDVHIEPTEDGTRVRYRMDGMLHTSLHLPKNVHSALVGRIKVLANMKLDETRLPQDGRFRMNIDGRDVDFRVSTMPLLGQEKVVMRILDKQAGLHSLGELGFTDHNAMVIERQLKRPHGMILITGPTGSGKSTTLYSMLQLLNGEESNIITIEDPVEYNLPGIAQSQVHPEIGLTFARGLRSILRQDPDIIMVGEIRDNETAELAVHAALTGHMLFSTLHTNDALGAIPRLIDMKIEPFLIASALNVIVAQRLVRKNCTNCLEAMALPIALESEVLAELEFVPSGSLPADISLQLPLRVSRGKGCPRCDNTGYKGRIAIVETLEVTVRLQEIISTGKITELHSVEEELRSQGMLTIKQDGLIKALRGFTTIEEVLTSTQENK